MFKLKFLYLRDSSENSTNLEKQKPPWINVHVPLQTKMGIPERSTHPVKRVKFILK